MMYLETERLIIRNVKPEDEVPFVEMASDGSLNDIGFDKNCSRWMENWITEAVALAETDCPSSDYLAYTIVLRETEMAIGSVGCSYYEDLQETGITYFVGAKYRGNGYAAEAVKAYIKYFFSHYSIPKLIAAVREENRCSWKVIEKSGFQLLEKRLYQDLNDDEKTMYRFYEIVNSESENSYAAFYQAARNDASAIAQMAVKMWNHHTIEELADEFEEIIDSDESVIYILSIKNQPAGFAQCQLRHDYVEGTSSSPAGYLEGIYVEPEYRKQGYAGALLQRCEAWAKDKGCAEFASDCELDNKAGYAFHLKIGFLETNRIICFTKKL
ncbi:MAG: GNAT family N-acetyltransferase [Lachnospiraceae bacterium]|nr:GNAT family N-acetyltransferase [Lachnospiraceae bacterium]